MSDSSQPVMQRYPQRATHWQLSSCRLEFGELPKLMGIVNVTPDSFSDGGKFFATAAAVDHALQLADEGADILDVGGESTRPYAEQISANEEMHRIMPVIERVAAQTDVPISVDTSKASVASAALAAGAQIINDVTGLQNDPEMLPLAAKTQAGVCAMHMQGTPQTMQDNPQYKDVVAEISAYLTSRHKALIAAGIARDNICLDPGIGFGKSHTHNFTLMSNCWQLHSLGYPLLVGHSRKGFLAKTLRDKTADRSFATLGAALALAAQGVQVLRVHEVRSVREALVAFAATGGCG